MIVSSPPSQRPTRSVALQRPPPASPGSTRPSRIRARAPFILALLGSIVAEPWLSGRVQAERKPSKDRDGDGIPDDFDPFPDDQGRPGKARANLVYAHTADALYTISPDTVTPQFVGNFRYADGRGRSVSDVAVDRFGVLYAVAFSELLVCDPSSARCEPLRPLMTSFNALDALDPGKDDQPDWLIGATTDGRWATLTGTPPTDVKLLGNYGAASSGDLMADGSETVGTRVSARGPDDLVRFRATSSDEPTLVEVMPESQIYGLAACRGKRLALSSSGTIYRSTAGGPWDRVGDTGIPWWGASCRAEFEIVSISADEYDSDQLPPEAKPTPPPPPAPEPPRGCACR